MAREFACFAYAQSGRPETRMEKHRGRGTQRLREGLQAGGRIIELVQGGGDHLLEGLDDRPEGKPRIALGVFAHA